LEREFTQNDFPKVKEVIMTKNQGQNRRPKILPLTVLKLWAMTAGRCEFYGCNEPLWRESLTMKEVNNSHISHIIAHSPSGPRGHGTLSKKLEKDFSNLMLVCRNHHNVIDSKEHEKDYPVELLKKYKEMHESRIKTQTAIQDDLKTTVLIFKANVGDRRVNFPTDKLDKAITPRYPDGKGVMIDLTSLNGNDNPQYWDVLKKHIAAEVRQNLKEGARQEGSKHLSVFAIGPIPLLVHLGNSIGSLVSIDLYHWHRDNQDWSWKGPGACVAKFTVKKPSISKSKSKEVALVLSLSGKIHRSEVARVFKRDMPVYEIAIPQPSSTFLKTKEQLLEFQRIYRATLHQIRRVHKRVERIHLFPAIPAPIAVTCGRELLPKIDPSLRVYDCDKRSGGFVFTLAVN